MANKKKKGKNKKKPAAPLTDRKFRNQIAAIFSRSGFEAFEPENVTIQVGTRPGELDGLFAFDNLMVVCERTMIAEPWTKHLAKKNYFFQEVLKDADRMTKVLRAALPAFDAYALNSQYDDGQFEYRIIYCSTNAVAPQHKAQCSGVKFLELRHLRYFLTLTRAIQQSARFEVFKFLDVTKDQLGEARLSGQSIPEVPFQATILPHNHTGFGSGFKVVTFYAAPITLMELSYVLRRASWEAPKELYQRTLMQKKISAMRAFLVKEGRVFVNNVIATLPHDAGFKNSQGNAVSDQDLSKPTPISLSFSQQYNTVGLIDGQHRVFAYHEGTDKHDAAISKLRSKQNLLVTAIVYPKSMTTHERWRFEGQLFLEINANQTSAKAELKQAIELLLTPNSPTALARAVVELLNDDGPLQALLEMHEFDDPGKLKISSIVTFGIRPLVRPGVSADTLFAIWNDEDKAKLLTSDAPDEVRERYLDFCATQIGLVLSAIKFNLTKHTWAVRSKATGDTAILTTTFLNGILKAIRLAVENQKTGNSAHYKSAFKKIEQVKFGDYKRSSLWSQLGSEIFRVCLK